MKIVRPLFVLTIGAAAALAACAPMRQETFYKAGISTEEFNRDTYECERDTRAAAASFGRGPMAAEEARGFAIRCMQARGYSYGYFQ